MVCFPALGAFVNRHVMRLPAGNRIRRTLVSRSFRMAYDPFSRGDFEAAFAQLHPDVEGHAPASSLTRRCCTAATPSSTGTEPAGRALGTGGRASRRRSSIAATARSSSTPSPAVAVWQAGWTWNSEIQTSTRSTEGGSFEYGKSKSRSSRLGRDGVPHKAFARLSQARRSRVSVSRDLDSRPVRSVTPALDDLRERGSIPRTRLLCPGGAGVGGDPSGRTSYSSGAKARSRIAMSVALSGSGSAAGSGFGF